MALRTSPELPEHSDSNAAASNARIFPQLCLQKTYIYKYTVDQGWAINRNEGDSLIARAGQVGPGP